MNAPHHVTNASGLRLPRRRRSLAHDLLADGIGTLILEGPYYNLRRPPGQMGSKVAAVADLVRLGAATIVEALWLAALLRSADVKVRRGCCRSVYARR